MDDLANTSLSPPRVVVDRHIGPRVVQGVVGVAVVCVLVVVLVLNRVLRGVGRTDHWLVVVCGTTTVTWNRLPDISILTLAFSLKF